MDIPTLFKTYTSEQKRALAERAGTEVRYLYQIDHGRRQPSPDLCKRLVAAEKRLKLRDLRPDIWGSGPVAAAHETA